jgi:predicted nucleotidyltransferase
MDSSQIISQIKKIGRESLPPNSKLLLYGSRARGDAHSGSDWDLLILLDKAKLEADDYDIIYPFRQFGWDIGEEISPHIYTNTQWEKWSFLPFYKNVERDKINLI